MKIRAFCIAIFLIVTVSIPSFAQSSSITNGLNWLSVNQNADGSWGGNAATTVIDSAEVIKAKMDFGNDSSIQNAATWFTTQEVVTVDELSRKVSSLAYTGTDTSSLISALINARNSENGWGYNAGYSSTPFETALALQALKSANFTDQTVIFGAITYLLSIQNQDGGWGFTTDDDSNVFNTAQVVSALSQYKTTYLMDTQLASATTFLLSKQNPDGGFGSNGSTVYETALAFIALIESGQTQGLPQQNAITYLTTTQLPNGSWNDDPYSTALALRALSYVKPDLAISASDIAVTPSAPTTGESIAITATVGNSGLETATNVTVRLLDNGATVGDQTIAAIAPSGTGQATFAISPLTPTGEHILTITVDPLNTIDEITKTNNSATNRIWAKALADLVVQPEYLTISPAYPKPAESVTLTFQIANMGESTASNVAADLYDGDPANGGVKLGSATVSSINAGGLGSGTITFSLATVGSHTLYLVADPLHAVTETSATNNTAQKVVTVNATGFIDLNSRRYFE